MCDKADRARDNETREELAKEGFRKTKRCFKLLRGLEKDLKLDVENPGSYTQIERNDMPLPSTPNNMKVQSKASLFPQKDFKF